MAKRKQSAKNSVIDHKSGKVVGEVALSVQPELDRLTKLTKEALIKMGNAEYEQVRTLSRGVIEHSITLGTIFNALAKSAAMSGKDLAEEFGIDGALVSKFRTISVLKGVDPALLPGNYDTVHRMLSQKNLAGDKVIQSADDFVKLAKSSKEKTFKNVKGSDVAETLGVTTPVESKGKKATKAMPNLIKQLGIHAANLNARGDKAKVRDELVKKAAELDALYNSFLAFSMKPKAKAKA